MMGLQVTRKEKGVGVVAVVLLVTQYQEEMVVKVEHQK